MHLRISREPKRKILNIHALMQAGNRRMSTSNVLVMVWTGGKSRVERTDTVLVLAHTQGKKKILVSIFCFTCGNLLCSTDPSDALLPHSCTNSPEAGALEPERVWITGHVPKETVRHFQLFFADMWMFFKGTTFTIKCVLEQHLLV